MTTRETRPAFLTLLLGGLGLEAGRYLHQLYELDRRPFPLSAVHNGHPYLPSVARSPPVQQHARCPVPLTINCPKCGQSCYAPYETQGRPVTCPKCRHRFTVPPGGHVVDAALAAGIRVPYSCKGGMCCTCRARLLEGQVEMTLNYSLEPWEIERGFILTCQAVPKSERLVVDYDQM